MSRFVADCRSSKRYPGSVIASLASGASVTESASAGGVERKTVQRWMKDPEFMAEVSRARREIVDRAVGQLTEGALAAAATLRWLVTEATSESVRLGAARSLLELGHEARSAMELEDRLAALERATQTTDKKGRRR